MFVYLKSVLLSVIFFKVFTISPIFAAELPASKFNTGYNIHSIEYQQNCDIKTLTVAVWYPTLSETKRYIYGGTLKGNVSFKGIPYKKDSPYPLLVFSHGYGGSGIGVAFLAEKIASYGWIVVSPDHNDRYSAVRIGIGPVENYNRRGLLKHASQIASSGPEERVGYLYRLEELKTVIDWILTKSPYSDIIDIDRIAAGGHSLGGFTALGISGTLKEYYDPRIKAILLFSTGAGGYLFTSEELTCVNIPSLIFLGEMEKNALRGRKTMLEIAKKIFKILPSPKYYLEIKGANHLSFCNQVSILRKDNPQIFDVINLYSIAFLEKYVAGKKEYDDILVQKHPLITSYIYEP